MREWIASAALGAWKSTIAGFLVAVAMVLYPIFASGRNPKSYEWGMAIASAVLGSAYGGTRAQKPKPDSGMGQSNTSQ